MLNVVDAPFMFHTTELKYTITLSVPLNAMFVVASAVCVVHEPSI
jgi:hypothetical protein